MKIKQRKKKINEKNVKCVNKKLYKRDFFIKLKVLGEKQELVIVDKNFHFVFFGLKREKKFC